jgi:hypothetical protein
VSAGKLGFNFVQFPWKDELLMYSINFAKKTRPEILLSEKNSQILEEIKATKN